MAMRLTGDDLAVFVIAANDAGMKSSEAAPRRAAFGARNDLRRVARARFSSRGRVWKAKGFAAAIVARQVEAGWWRVSDKATYRKKRSALVGLMWVFDNAPIISGKKGWTAVPIPGAAPIASNGRRYAWPSEAAARGFQLEIAPVIGKKFKIIFGRQGREPWRAMWFWIPPYKAKKAFDVSGVYRKHEAAMERYWLEDFDRRAARLPRARVA